MLVLSSNRYMPSKRESTVFLDAIVIVIVIVCNVKLIVLWTMEKSYKLSIGTTNSHPHQALADKANKIYTNLACMRIIDAVNSSILKAMNWFTRSVQNLFACKFRFCLQSIFMYILLSIRSTTNVGQ